MMRKEFPGFRTWSPDVCDVVWCTNSSTIKWVKQHLFERGEFDIEVILTDEDGFFNDKCSWEIDSFYYDYMCGEIRVDDRIPHSWG